jgi:hypothetical protein
VLCPARFRAGVGLIAVGGATASGGTSIAGAPLVQSGVQESANTVTDATSQGSEGIGRTSGCWTDLEYWRLPLVAGDDVLITGGAVSPGANLEIAVFPPGTTNANIANASAVGDGLPLGRGLHFTASSTGTYPVVAGPTCYDGTDGPFDFVVTVTHTAASLDASASLPSVMHVAAAGEVAAIVRASDGASISLDHRPETRSPALRNVEGHAVRPCEGSSASDCFAQGRIGPVRVAPPEQAERIDRSTSGDRRWERLPPRLVRRAESDDLLPVFPASRCAPWRLKIRDGRPSGQGRLHGSGVDAHAGHPERPFVGPTVDPESARIPRE